MDSGKVVYQFLLQNILIPNSLMYPLVILKLISP